MRGLTIAAALSSGAMLLATAATAAPLETNMQYQADYDEGAPTVWSGSDASSSMAWTSLSEDYGRGYAASNQNGILGAQAIAGRNGDGGGAAAARMVLFSTAPGDDGGADGPVPTQVTTLSEARWETTITNTSLNPLDYTFIFHVYGPTLQTAPDSGEARVALNISTDNLSGLYQADASLVGGILSADPRYGPFSYDGSENSYRFGDFDAAVSIGTIASGASFTLTYVMSAYAFATDMEHYSLAYIGDPFSFGQGPDYRMLTSAVPTPGVPEPASWAMLILGFGLIGMAVRRRQGGVARAC